MGKFLGAKNGRRCGGTAFFTHSVDVYALNASTSSFNEYLRKKRRDVLAFSFLGFVLTFIGCLSREFDAKIFVQSQFESIS